jgi:hypothetical protein
LSSSPRAASRVSATWAAGLLIRVEAWQVLPVTPNFQASQHQASFPWCQGADGCVSSCAGHRNGPSRPSRRLLRARTARSRSKRMRSCLAPPLSPAYRLAGVSPGSEVDRRRPPAIHASRSSILYLTKPPSFTKTGPPARLRRFSRVRGDTPQYIVYDLAPQITFFV